LALVFYKARVKPSACALVIWNWKSVLKRAGLTTWSDAFFYAALPAIISAEFDWGDMKRKFSLAPGEDRTMI